MRNRTFRHILRTVAAIRPGAMEIQCTVPDVARFVAASVQNIRKSLFQKWSNGGLKMGFWVIFSSFVVFCGQSISGPRNARAAFFILEEGTNMPYDRFCKTFPVSLTVWQLLEAIEPPST